MDNWSKYLQEVANVLTVREHYQRTLGEIVSKIIDLYGKPALEGFAEEVKQTYGLTVSQSTLKNYAWTWEKTHDLGFPDDISYRSLQYIASSGDPTLWAKRIKDEGLSSIDIYKLIRESKGLTQKTKIVICDNCGKEVAV